MDYPSGTWKYCSCGESYFRYDDGTGECSSCWDKARKREEKADRDAEKVKKLKKENKKLKELVKGNGGG